jgi:hypothetical protein
LKKSPITYVAIGLAVVASAAFASNKVKTVKPFFTDLPPEIDGVLDDAVWYEVEARDESIASGFTYRGYEGEELYYALEPTDIAIAYDEKNLYLGVSCYMVNSDDLVSRILIRDEPLWYDDSIEIFIDTFYDHKSAYYFSVNPSNTQMDGVITEEGEVESRNWDGVWYSATSIDRYGWYAEIKIPFRILRFSMTRDVWGLNIVRFHTKTQDQTIWNPVGENLLRVSAYGEMAGMSRISKRPTLDVLPYFSTEYRSIAKMEEGSGDYDVGIDVTSRVLPSFEITATYKPDFAQVEADPYRINLTDEELFFPEKRPFFLEGLQYFDTPIMAFYTRRVGDIDYGFKGLGRVGPTHVYGMGLKATERQEDPENPGGPYRFNYLVGRLKQDITKHAYVGFLGYQRKGETWDANRALSADAGISFNDELIFTGQYIKAQDRETDVDDEAYTFSFDRYTSGLSLGGGYEDIGRRMDVLKCSYIPYDDAKGYWGWLDYNWWLWSLGMKKINVYGYYEKYLNHNSSLSDIFEGSTDTLARETIVGQVGLYFINKITFEFYAEHNFRSDKYKEHWIIYDPLDPDGESHIYREVPYSVVNDYYSIFTGYNLDEWSNVYAFYEFGSHYDFDLNYWGGGFRINPIPRLGVAYDIDYELLDGEFVLKEPGEPVEKLHYEFIINRLHLNLSITDDLQLRTFIQSSSDLGHYATNAVLSWEYLKGSHAYLVYNEKRLFKEHLRDDIGRGVLDRLLFFKINYFLGI